MTPTSRFAGKELREKKDDDPLWSWKKHSGFKKGLATDIILGDEHHQTITSQDTTNRSISTMHSDYTRKNVAASGLDSIVPAGKSLGLSSSSKIENHIVFGDEKMISGGERYASVTNRDYKHHAFVKPAITKPGSSTNASLNSNNNKSTLVEKHHSKAQTATSMAHIGLQTRQDLPIDDHHFHSYVTTTQDAYGGPIDVSESIAIRAQVQESHQGRPSHIHLGDTEKLHLYETEHDSAFVSHDLRSNGNDGVNSHHSRLANKGSSKSSIVFGHVEKDPSKFQNEVMDMYVSTSMSTYIPSRPEAVQRANSGNKVIKTTGKSSISFGESLEERRSTETSVTKRDFTSKPLLQCPDDDSVKCRTHESTGLLYAMGPDSKSKTTTESQQSMYSRSFRPISESETRKNVMAAGACHLGPRGSVSSVPMGDTTHFDFDRFTTSTCDSFIAHPPDPTLTHPVLGAQMTKSKVQLGDQESLQEVGFDQYATTTNQAFIVYSPKEAQKYRGVRVKPQGSLVVKNDADPDYSMTGNMTTHQAHFQLQSMAHRQRAIKPHLASKRMLFPLETNQPSHYETTSATYFSMRDGLLSTTYKPFKVNRESAIVFGDPKQSYFQDSSSRVNA